MSGNSPASSGDGTILVGRGARDERLLLSMANRHGLIAGATGTGKTVTLRVLAEGLADAGVPVFLADVKGDIAGMAEPGADNARVIARVAELGLEGFKYRAFPVIFWDVFGRQGHPVRSTISELGPFLLARLLQLNEIQAGVLQIVFRLADDEGLLLLDLKDLRAMLAHVADRAKELTTEYGNVSAASVGAIQRAVLALEEEGADQFFSEPALALGDLLQTDQRGRGAVNVLAASELMQRPKLYATFLLWMLSELYEQLPEIGDVEKPKLVFFFDEAHLLFDDAPPALVDKVEQVVRLIRSKGVGIFFITQNPLDIPEKVLGQLGNRVQHALRAFTPRDQKSVRAAAETFRGDGKLDVATAITELGVGEALVSFLDSDGVPGIVDRSKIVPSASRLGPLLPAERKARIDASPYIGKYDQPVDRESAYERLTQAAKGEAPPSRTPGPIQAEAPDSNPWGTRPGGTAGPWGSPPPQQQSEPVRRPRAPMPRAEPAPRPSNRQSVGETVAKQVARSIAAQVGSSIGRQIVRGVLGSIMGSRR